MLNVKSTYKDEHMVQNSMMKLQNKVGRPRSANNKIETCM